MFEKRKTGMLLMAFWSVFSCNPAMQGMVLCIAEEGHVALEFPPLGGCSMAEEQSDATPDSPERSVKQCGACTDVPLPVSQGDFLGTGPRAGHDKAQWPMISVAEEPESIHLPPILSLRFPPNLETNALLRATILII